MKIDRSRIVAIVSILALIITVASGALLENRYTPIAVLVAIFTVTLLVLWHKIKPHDYPIYIWGLSLASLYQTSMIGTYIIGVDIHTELATINSIVANGWNIGLANGNNSSIVLGAIAPFFNWLGIEPVQQLKVLFPLIFSFTPLLLYFAYSKMIGNKRAYLASLFFIIMPMFTIETVNMAKSMVAFTCLALALLIMASDLKPWQKATGILLASTGAILSHYTVGIITVCYLIAIALFSPATRIKLKNKLPVKYAVIVATSSVLTIYLWFSTVGGGFMINTLAAIGTNLVYSQSDTSLSELYLDRTHPTQNRTYLDSQEPLIRTALGLDFMDVSAKGKAFRLVQFATQGCILAGLIFLIVKCKQYNFTAEFAAGIYASLILLLMCLFVPFFATTVSASRFYAMSLVFLSPVFIVGGEQLLRLTKRVKPYALYGVTGLLLIYFLFTSGSIFEVTHAQADDKLELPSSIALSNYRTNVLGVFNKDDIACAKWIVKNNMLVKADYNGSCLLLGYNYDPGQYSYLSHHYYVFLTTWNTENEAMVIGRELGIREYLSLPDKLGQVTYRQGKATVYTVEENNASQ